MNTKWVLNARLRKKGASKRRRYAGRRRLNEGRNFSKNFEIPVAELNSLPIIAPPSCPDAFCPGAQDLSGAAPEKSC
jgi:hypothetical protein